MLGGVYAADWSTQSHQNVTIIQENTKKKTEKAGVSVMEANVTGIGANVDLSRMLYPKTQTKK